MKKEEILGKVGKTVNKVKDTGTMFGGWMSSLKWWHWLIAGLAVAAIIISIIFLLKKPAVVPDPPVVETQMVTLKLKKDV